MKERSEEKGFNFPYLYDESQEVALLDGIKMVSKSPRSVPATSIYSEFSA